MIFSLEAQGCALFILIPVWDVAIMPRNPPSGDRSATDPSLQKFIDDAVARAKRRVATKVRGPTPDLEALVIAHDGYDKIPREAWMKFDREMAEWKAHVRSGAKYYRWKDI